MQCLPKKLKCCNPNLGLTTKARACKDASQTGSPGVTSHALESVRECEGMNLHTPKWAPILGIGVLMDSQIFRKQLQGSKPIRFKKFLYHWKTLVMKMFKMGLHDPFGHFKHKLWPKEGLGVRNRPDFLMCKWRATYHWKALEDCYNFASNLISIRGLHTKL